MRIFEVSVHIIEPTFFLTNMTVTKTLTDSMRSTYESLPQETKDQYGQQFVDDCKYIVACQMSKSLQKESRATLTCLFRTSGRLLLLQPIIVDSRHFTQPELSLWCSDLHEIKSFKDVLYSMFGPDLSGLTVPV